MGLLPGDRLLQSVSLKLIVDSHGQARGTQIYTLHVNDKRIHTRLKAWSSALPCVTRGNLYCEHSEHEGEALVAFADGGGDVSPSK